MKKLRVVFLGITHDHGLPVYKTLLDLPDEFEVVAWSADESENPRIAEIMTWDKSLDRVPRVSVEEALNLPDIDAAIVECPDLTLTKYCILAAQKGLPIHMDKPGGVDTVEYEKMLSVVKKNGTVFHTGYMYRFNPLVMKLMEQIKNGELGKIYSVEAHMDCDHNAQKRAWLGQFPGGMMYYLGCHLVDLVYRIQGIPDEIHAYDTATGFDGVTAKDVGFAVFTYPNGISFIKSSASEPGGFRRRQLVVCGEKKTVHIEPIEMFSETPDCLSADMKEFTHDYSWRDGGSCHHLEPTHRYKGMMQHFASLVRGEKENPYTPEYEARLHRMILCACGEKVDYKQEILLS